MTKKIMSWLATFGFIYFVSQSCQALAASKNSLSDVNITDAVVYVPLGNSKTTTAIFTLHNHSNSEIFITKVSSPSVKEISLVPAVAIKNKGSKETSPVETQNPWRVEPGGFLRLVPKRQYLQLIGLKNSLTTGDELQLEVSLGNGKKLFVTARAKSAYDQMHGN